jgi:hypothetical protein
MVFCSYCKVLVDKAYSDIVAGKWICAKCYVKDGPIFVPGKRSCEVEYLYSGGKPKLQNIQKKCEFCKKLVLYVGWTWQGWSCESCWKSLDLDRWHGSFANNREMRVENRGIVISGRKKEFKPKIAEVHIEEIGNDL